MCSYLAVPKVDVEVDELAVLLHQVSDFGLIQIFIGLFFHVQSAKGANLPIKQLHNQVRKFSTGQHYEYSTVK